MYASLQRGQYQLKCIKLNKYQPVELFQLLDADTGLRANRSSTGKKKDDDRNLINNAEVTLLITSTSPFYYIITQRKGEIYSSSFW